MTSSKTRPLSPHLQIYKLPLVAKLSISHRFSGLALSAGAVLLVLWLGSAAYGQESYDCMTGLMASWVGRIVLFIFTLAYFYHICHGIRHLFWNAGIGYGLKTITMVNRIELIVCFSLTLITWFFGLSR
jgi:succinate dehydrogenase / fumarate reductase cytochrome b subunit